jgi:hypothetical protein
MVGLLDIAPLTKVVPVNGCQVTVTGISATSVAYLLDKFPAIKTLIAGRKITDPQEMIKAAPDAVAAIIAAGTGGAGNVQVEAAAAALPLEAQLDLIEAIMTITMPSGFGPFVDRLSGLLGGNPPDNKPNGHDAQAAAPGPN